MGSKPSAHKIIVQNVELSNIQDIEHNQPDDNTEETGAENQVIVLRRFDNKAGPNFRDPLLVIAIDFGTTFSGYVFSFKGYKRKFLTANHGYILEDGRLPTIVLLNPDKTFNSFGYEAQETYSKLNEEKTDYYYFEHFKMALFKTMESTNKAEIRDSKDRPVDAKKVFIMLIENLLRLAMEIGKGLQKDDIRWVITIPAVWSVLAENIIRESALSVGIDDERNLRFVLEPYAASMYCMQRNLYTDQDSDSERESNSSLEPVSDDPSHGDPFVVGNKYIIADIGGGTSDIWVYEVKRDKELQELYRATEEIGGLSVNSAFGDLMEALVGETVWSKFLNENDHTVAYQDFMRDFERKKRIFSTEMDTVTMSVENALLDVLENTTGKSFGDVLEKLDAGDKILFKSQFHKLTLDKETMEEMFEPSVNGILRLLEETLKKCQQWRIDAMFMTGGFSDSPYLRETIKSKFSDIRVVFPEDAKLAVLKGAVMMGYNPEPDTNTN